MIKKIKLDLRINHDKLDLDIEAKINACMADMKRVGVIKVREEDPLIIQCCKWYCRWQYNFENQGDKYKTYYEGLRNDLSMSGDYNV